MVINVLDHVERCYSNEDGKIILHLLKRALKSGETVEVSFEGVNSLTSSFTNTALIELLKDFEFVHIKKHLRFINTNRTINGMIRDRFEFESQRYNNKELVTV